MSISRSNTWRGSHPISQFIGRGQTKSPALCVVLTGTRVLMLRQFAEHLESNNRRADAAVLLQEIEKTKKKVEFVRQAVTSE
jgi:hypothetical protein